MDLSNTNHDGVTRMTEISAPTQAPESLEKPPIQYNISQHYHHSAHLVPPVSSSQASDTTADSPSSSIKASSKYILSQHDVDPSSLLPSQLTLFEQADTDQQLRLIELWRISPPDFVRYRAEDIADDLGKWQHTTLEREEEMARLRYERNILADERYDEEIQVDKDCVSIPASNFGGDSQQVAEPYITYGYEHLAQRDYDQHAEESSDRATFVSIGSTLGDQYGQGAHSAYQGKEWWQNFVNQQSMEHQYGLFDQINQFRPEPETSADIHDLQDEEML
ncbi:hypothetical protein MMC12_007214 [Toensbergia leucococca]|nr:hypothetical protein [Toensbergia leucococca]